MSPGQQIPPDVDCFVIAVAGKASRAVAAVQQIPPDVDCFVIGRDSDCQLAIPSQSVNRRHAQLRLQEGKWYIEDLRSRNGTRVNGQQIRSRTPLSHNDEIRVPDFVAVFENA